LLLVTDLDHTLVGDDAALAQLNSWLSAHRATWHWVYATGRSYVSAKQLQAEVGLLEPDYWVTGVGSEIYSRTDGDMDGDMEGDGGCDRIWSEKLSTDWHYPTVAQIAAQFSELIPQEESTQNPWKCSFELSLPNAEEILAQLQESLNRSGLATQIIYSSYKHVDILPKAGNKGNAMQYLMTKLNQSPQDTLACGDSGNDISLFEQGTKGVIVGNAQTELLTWHADNPHPRLFLAQAHCAGGILEALAHWQWY
jgi:sucrose-6-phosphatase